MLFSFVNIIGFTFANMNSFLTEQASLPSSVLTGRYISYEHISLLLQDFDHTPIGKSVLGQPIQQISIGSGPIKILMWSQMHGNESTSTKGLFDVLYFLKANPALLSRVSLRCIPMLNPDGAAAYTRLNANAVDLNRDALNQSQPEARSLLDAYAAIKPDYCFNLHDQRTIFGVDGAPCMLSFLAPAADETKSITDARKKAMGIIGRINAELQSHISGQVGRYDDTYNPNCMGDYFQSQGTPTLLFECGQVGEDYQRENTRKWFAVSLLAGLKSVTNKLFLHQEYAIIPEVEKNYVDILLQNAQVEEESVDIALHYVESMQEGKVVFTPIIHSMGNLGGQHAHKIIDFSNERKLNKSEVLLEKAVDWVTFF